MRKFLIFTCKTLTLICDLQHKFLPRLVDDVVQQGWILIFGYHCPFVHWSLDLDEKYNLGVWE